ncbi:tetratricopeptide repeat protein [Aquimarina longa]|uniref:tetratricopeptide repeat protein n=1 Tax=Aquimarina longa TaxID=1080221 RepID=UPI00078465B5|nr:hypothetical protein [Aquimarina longa]
MNRSLSTFDKIEDFLANRLSIEDHAAFKKEMTKNSQLQLEVERHRILQDVLRDKRVLDFKKNLQSIQQEFYEEENVEIIEKQKSLYRYWKIAAVVILLLGVSGMIWQTFIPTNLMQDLYTAYYTPYPITVGTRSETEENWETIVEEYAIGNYTKVVSVFETLDTISLTEEMKLCIGNSYLHTHQEQKAIVMFSNIRKDSGLYEDALWYLTLTYIKMEECKNAITILEKIMLYNGKYRDKAIQVKEKLQSL